MPGKRFKAEEFVASSGGLILANAFDCPRELRRGRGCRTIAVAKAGKLQHSGRTRMTCRDSDNVLEFVAMKRGQCLKATQSVTLYIEPGSP